MPPLSSTNIRHPSNLVSFRRNSITGLLTGLLSIYAASAFGQATGPRLIDPSAQFPHLTTPKADPGSVASDVPSAAVAVPSGAPVGGFTLTNVTVQGAAAVDPAQLAATWQPLLGKPVTTQDVAAIGSQIAQLYAKSGYELVSVEVPDQTFAGGKVVIVVTEGQIAAVTIEGNTDDADLTLLKNYAAAIIADRPLRRSTLERYILLMNDIPGLKVGSRFDPMPGEAGAVRLVLSILQKQFEWGAQVNNLGTNSLGNTQATVVGAVNNLFEEGDQTQLTLGAPAEFRRYQYIGLSHRDPIGSDGASVVLGAGYLRTDPSGPALSGNANIESAVFNYPVIRSVDETLLVSGGVDMLNSNSALLGMALANERTRNLRLSAVYSLNDTWRGTSVISGTLSQGISGLGAHRGNVAYGGPTYTKLNVLLTREQQLGWQDVILRAKLQGQYALNHLPNSEQFLFGGPYLGRGFDTAYLSGDRGVAAGLEIAHPTPASITPDFLAGSEGFGFIDWGEAINIKTHYLLPYAHGASAGGGVRFKLMDKATVELGAAWVVNQPSQFVKVESPRFIFGFTRNF